MSAVPYVSDPNVAKPPVVLFERKYNAPKVRPVVVSFPAWKITVPLAPLEMADGTKPTAAFATAFASAFMIVPDAET